MADKIKIDIVSDVVCPFSAMGYRKLQTAIKELDAEDKVDIEWHPFELNPGLPAEGLDSEQYRSERYGLNKEQSRQKDQMLIDRGKEVGINFDLSPGMKVLNTFDAHILLDYAKEFGKQTELNVRLATAFFSERKDISNRAILAKEMESVGLDVDDGLARLDDVASRERVEAQKSHWQSLGVSAVPTMFFNQSSALSGAQPVEFYKRALTDLMNNNDNKSMEKKNAF